MRTLSVYAVLLVMSINSAHALYWTPASNPAGCGGHGAHNCTNAEGIASTPPGPGYICCSYSKKVVPKVDVKVRK